MAVKMIDVIEITVYDRANTDAQTKTFAVPQGRCRHMNDVIEYYVDTFDKQPPKYGLRWEIIHTFPMWVEKK